jgi:hypothetical protein
MPVLLDDPCQGVILSGDPVFYYSGDTVEWTSPDPANPVEAGIGWSRPRSLAKAAYRSGRADSATLGTPPVAPAELGTTWVAWMSTTDTPQFFGSPLSLTFLAQSGYLFAYGIGMESIDGVSLLDGVLYWNADSFGTNMGHVKGTTIINDGEPHLIAAVKSRTASDESLVTIYVDGVAEGSSIVTNLQADGALFQGASGDYSFGNIGLGYWAHIGIYNRALTDLEIAAIYAAGTLDETYRPSRYVFNGLAWAPMISPKTVVADVGVYGDPLLKTWYGAEWYPDFPTPGLVNKTFGLRWSVEGLINATKSLRWSVADANPLPASPQRREATDSDSWRSSDGWKDGYVYQGEYSTNGNYRGCWFLGTSNPFPDLRGKNYVITSATVRMRRTTSGGDGGNSAVYCGTHQYVTKPDGTPTISNAQNVGTLAWGGETKEMPIPISWARDLIEGDIRGFGLYRSTGSPYLRTEGTGNYELDGRVTINFKAA